jgi:hypothetical protein
MDVQVDLWTSNLDQKHQLIEQMLIAIYPQFEIQNSDNALDWTAVTICFVEDDLTFSSRTLPIGTSDEIDILTLRLRVPFWLTPPAMIRKLGRIEEIITNVGDQVSDFYGDNQIGTIYEQVIITPENHAIAVDGNLITLLAHKGHVTMPDGSMPSWRTLFTHYGIFRNGKTQLHLMLSEDIEGPFVSGSLQYGPTDNEVIWAINPNTLPPNTLTPIDAVIDPMRTSPGHELPQTTGGTRYLLIHDVGPCANWGNLTAYTNDIIQYNSTLAAWQVDFDARTTLQTHYVLNRHTTRQLRWNGREWLMSIDNYYNPGFWRIIL